MSKLIEQEAITRQLVHAMRELGKDKTFLLVVATHSEIKLAAHGEPGHIRDVLQTLLVGFDSATQEDLARLRKPEVKA